MIKRRHRRRDRRTDERCMRVEEEPLEEAYFVDIDFTKGDNTTLTVADQMGRATVTLEGYTGDASNGFVENGLVSTSGGAMVRLTNLDLDAIKGPLELGMQLTDISWTKISRGVYMMGRKDETTLFQAYTRYLSPTQSITLEYDTTNRGQLYASSNLLLEQPIFFSLVFDKTHTCMKARIDKGDGTIETAQVQDNDGNTVGIHTITQPLTGLTEILLMNRADGARLFKGTLQRFFIRRYIPEKGG
ncbi:MAG: hypothetical protein Q4F79_07250 [Eubacteriales bacterium]|nr:hypothetical protein [Eubacteriales bacterium]